MVWLRLLEVWATTRVTPVEPCLSPRCPQCVPEVPPPAPRHPDGRDGRHQHRSQPGPFVSQALYRRNKGTAAKPPAPMMSTPPPRGP